MRRKLAGDGPSPETPLVLIGRDARRRVVTAADLNALELGLYVGMPATKAQALVPDLAMIDADPIADAKGLDRLALWVLQHYAPIVAADLPDGLVIDTTGSDHLHGGEHAMLVDIAARFAGWGISARVAVADSWGAAHAFARFSGQRVSVVESSKTTERLLNLPIAALRLPTDMVASLRVLGFERIGELAAQPRAPLALRFGPELGRRLDQAMGRLAEPITPLRPADLIEMRQIFAEPIGAAETIARYIGKLVTQLCAVLEAKGLGAKRVDLLCHRVDSTIAAVRVGTSLPVRDPKRLTRLLTDKIETIDPGFGIELMTIAATLVEPIIAKQAATSLIDDGEADVSDLVDTIGNLVGADRLYRMTPAPSDVPERSFKRVAPMAPDIGKTWQGRWPLPTRLLPNPEAIETLAALPDHPPVVFTWRGIRHRVKRADGPERVFGEWWTRDPEMVAVRDYFRIEDEAGERFWVYRAGDGEDAKTGSHGWFLHGIYG